MRSDGLNLLPFMRVHDMLPEKGGRILCAVSGGRDSMCLLHYLWKLGETEGFTVAAVHMNHGQRDTAERDVCFVQNFCRERRIPCVTERVSVPEKAKEWGVGIEEAGRRLRYAAFERAAELTQADRIATAHHAGDQAETVLLNLLRGTGPEGLTGIPPVRGNIIRPLLQTSRREIEAYLAENGIPHIEDETNGDITMTRNRLRLTVMPLLKELYPAAEESICRTAEILRREEACWQEQVRSALPEKGAEASCAALLALPYALRLRVMRALTERMAMGRKDFGAVHYEAMEALLHKDGGTLRLPDGVVALRRGDVFLLQRIEKQEASAPLAMGTTLWGGYKITCERKRRPYAPQRNEMALGRDTIGSELTVSACRSGEGLRLAGSRGRRSVKRLCAERGIDPVERDHLPAIYAGERLAAVWPLGADEEFLPRETDGEMIIIKLEKEKSGGYSNG